MTRLNAFGGLVRINIWPAAGARDAMRAAAAALTNPAAPVQHLFEHGKLEQLSAGMGVLALL
jgi:hypothetical protein